MKWYQLKTTQVLQKLASQTDGLNKTQRQERLMENGENKIAEKQQVKPWRKFLKHFTDLLMLVLLFAAILKFMTGDLVEGGIILLVVVVNGLVSYWQERKAEESLDGLKQMMSQEAVILTNGQKNRAYNLHCSGGHFVFKSRRRGGSRCAPSGSSRFSSRRGNFNW